MQECEDTADSQDAGTRAVTGEFNGDGSRCIMDSTVGNPTAQPSFGRCY